MSKTINGTTSSPSLWTYKLVVTETATDVTNQKSTIKVEHYLGRKSGAGSSYFSGSLTYKTTIDGNTKTTNKSMSSGTIASGGWKKIGDHTFTVSNTGNPTTINISGQQTSSAFNPSSSSASGTMDLTVLHIPPTITNIQIEETDATMIALNVPDDTIVYNLSVKQFTITADYNDNASLSQLDVYCENQLIGTANTNVVVGDFNGYNSSNVTLKLTDTLGGITNLNLTYPNIPYTKPTLENTYIKRKTDSVTSLTDEKGSLNLLGYYYAENDVIGNNNTITKVEYKIWNGVEPSYTDITTSATIGSGEVNVNGYEILGIEIDKRYDYKIVITDYFGNQSEVIVGSIATGLPIWTEYVDHVDFYGLTVKKQQILMPYSLYDNSSGSTGNIQLSDSSANYEYLEIYYKDDINQYASTKVYQPDGKRVTLSMTVVNPSNTQTFVQTACKDISGANITHQKASEIRIDSHNATTSNYIYITKVVGYK